CSSFDNFAVELQRAFELTKPRSEAAHKLARLQQGKGRNGHPRSSIGFKQVNRDGSEDQAYDYAIDLIPGTTPPRRRLYSLSAPEREVMQQYLNEALAAGLIRPSSSPAGAGFFFVGKKDGGLRPCIDYRGLNQITIKNRYPLPLISSAFELLQEDVIFTKLDLCNAYHLVRICKENKWKTAFNTPTSHFEYMVCLTNATTVFQNLVIDVL
ncbi:hypothetical protein QTP70_024337, partial [Hemibagrus guttatus]